MYNIKKIYLSGLGAIGSTYGGMLYDIDPGCIKVIADEDRIRRYSSKGVTIGGRPYPFNYVLPAEGNFDADLIIIAVKQHNLEQSLNDIEKFVGENTIILSLLNGIVSEEIIGKKFGMEKMLYSFCVGIDAVREGTGTTYSKAGTIVFGDVPDSAASPKVAAVRELFEKAHISYSIPENILRELWWKFMLNVGVNQVSALLRASYGIIQKTDDIRDLIAMASREVIKISGKAGIHLTENDITGFMKIVDTLSPEGKTSMLQDIEAGRKTELEIFAGTVLELGKKYGIETPVNDMLFKSIRALEHINSIK